MARPTIVYILSRGHSGSTLLDLLLSSHDRIASVGELKQLVEREDPRCTCEAGRVRECSFWHDISERLVRRTGKTLFELPIESEEPGELRAANHAVYEEVAAATGVSVIVDSSKERARLGQLLKDGSFDLRVIRLERHPYGVVSSYVRKGQDWRREALLYGRELALSRRVLKGYAHRTVRYEDLAVRPAETVESLMEWIGVPFDPSQLEWSGRTRHNVGGNRMRFSTSSEIRVDESWKLLTLHQRLWIRILVLGARLWTQGVR